MDPYNNEVIWKNVSKSCTNIYKTALSTSKRWIWQFWFQQDNIKDAEQNYGTLCIPEIDGVVQDCGISIAYALEMLQSCSHILCISDWWFSARLWYLKC